MRFDPQDLSYLIGRELHDVLCCLGDYSANPRGSKTSLAVRAAKREVQSESLTTLKGDVLHRILRYRKHNLTPALNVWGRLPLTRMLCD